MRLVAATYACRKNSTSHPVKKVAWMWIRSGWTSVPKTSGPKYPRQKPATAMDAVAWLPRTLSRSVPRPLGLRSYRELFSKFRSDAVIPGEPPPVSEHE